MFISVRAFFLGVFLGLLSACQPTSLEDFQLEGASLSRSLLKDLRRIECREDLALMEPVLKKKFEKFADLIIQARTFQQKNLEFEIPSQHINQALNHALVEEIKRIYSIEGGRESIERAQREAMLKLDAKEKLIEKQQRSIRLK